MKVKFLGRRSIQWAPTLGEPNAAADVAPGDVNIEVGAALGDVNAFLQDVNVEVDATLPTDTRFLNFLRDEINVLDQVPSYLSLTERAEKRMWFLAVLTVALDPTASLFLATPEAFFKTEPHMLELHFEGILSLLASKLSAQTSTWLISRAGRGPPREYADVKAQREVPRFYDNRCVLTGTMKPQGAHIIPVRSKAVDHKATWNALRMFWPLPAVEVLDLPGRERENILPLTHTVHDMWDSFHFGIRPIEHPTDPLHRLYIQMVWLIDMNGNRVDSDWNHTGFGSASDYRRGSTPNFPAVRHGDVYELETEHPAAEPLPSFHFLQIQYAVHKIIAGIKGAGALKVIFSGDPPSDAGGYGARVDNIDDIDDINDIDVPPKWQPILEAAVDVGVLTKAKALLWGKAFSKDAKDKEEAQAQLTNVGGDEEVDEESEQPDLPLEDP